MKRDGPDRDEPFDGPRADLGRRTGDRYDHHCRGVIVGLYFGREVLVPIALAVLLSFVLARVVALARLRIGTVASVLLAVALAFAVLAALALSSASRSPSSPRTCRNISRHREKLQAVRSSALSTGVVEKAADALHGLESNLGQSPRRPIRRFFRARIDPARRSGLIPVEVHEPAPGPAASCAAS